MSNATCCVLVPSLGEVDAETMRGLTELSRRGYVLRVLRGATCIDQVRSLMASDALRDGFEDLMWIDSDIGFNPDDVDRLRGHGLDFVCGLYTKKGAPELAGSMLPETTEVTMGEGGGLLQIRYAAMGFTLTRAAVYRTMERFDPSDDSSREGVHGDRPSMPTVRGYHDRVMRPYFMPMVKDGQYLGEDYAFSWRATEAGFRVMADTTIRLFHFGRYAYSYEDLAGRQRTPTVQLSVSGAAHGEKP